MSKYSDIGKSTNDLLNKDFPVNIIKLEAKGNEKTGQNILSKYQINGTRDATSGVVAGEVKNTMTCLLSRPAVVQKELSNTSMILEVTSTLTTDGTITEQLELKEPLIKGLNVNASGSLAASSNINAKVGFDFVQPLMNNVMLHSNATVDLMKGPKMIKEVALRYNGFVLGAQAHVCGDRSAANLLDNYSGALGYELNHYKASLHALNKGNVLTAAFFQKFSSGVETGFKATWNRHSTKNYGIELVSKFPLDHGSWLKCKLDNAGKVGVAYSTPLNNKVSLTLAAAFDTMKMDDKHRLGMGLVVDL